MATSLLAAGELPGTTRVEDPTGLASGALLYRVELAPGESRDVDLLAPLIGDMPFKANDWSASDLQAQTAQAWSEQLDDVDIDVPPAGQGPDGARLHAPTDRTRARKGTGGTIR